MPGMLNISLTRRRSAGSCVERRGVPGQGGAPGLVAAPGRLVYSEAEGFRLYRLAGGGAQDQDDTWVPQEEPVYPKPDEPEPIRTRISIGHTGISKGVLPIYTHPFSSHRGG